MTELLAGDFLRQELRHHYQELLCNIGGSLPLNERLTVFSPLVGCSFETSESRLLICGRAVDGWRNTLFPDGAIEESLNTIFKIPEADRSEKCEMHWIQRNRKAWQKDHKKGYNYKSSSFWSCAREVVKAFETMADINDDNWHSRLVWSNIYKISPQGGGNPGERLRSKQIKECSAILQTEIRILKPKNILFITGGWGKKILESLDIHPDHESKKVVQYAEKVGAVNVVITVRPERQKRAFWVSEVISAFGELSASTT
jgi:hypothetical protein